MFSRTPKESRRRCFSCFMLHAIFAAACRFLRGAMPCAMIMILCYIIYWYDDIIITRFLLMIFTFHDIFDILRVSSPRCRSRHDIKIWRRASPCCHASAARCCQHKDIMLLLLWILMLCCRLFFMKIFQLFLHIFSVTYYYKILYTDTRHTQLRVLWKIRWYYYIYIIWAYAMPFPRASSLLLYAAARQKEWEEKFRVYFCRHVSFCRLFMLVII